MNKPCFNDAIEPMTLGNMRANGVCSLDVSCWNCHHRAIMSADAWPNDAATGRQCLSRRWDRDLPRCSWEPIVVQVVWEPAGPAPAAMASP